MSVLVYDYKTGVNGTLFSGLLYKAYSIPRTVPFWEIKPMLVIQKINLTYFKTFFGEPPTAKALCTYEKPRS